MASKNIYGVELDKKVMNQFAGKWKDCDFGPLFETFQSKDFFRLIIGYIMNYLYTEVYIVIFNTREKLTEKSKYNEST